MSPENVYDGDHETIPVANRMAEKVAGRKVAGAAALFAAADRVLIDLAGGYLGRARAELDEAGGMIEAALADENARADALDTLFRIAHDMKGQAATFGYPLATEIAALLCGILKRRPDLDEGAIRIAEAHVNGLKAVLGNGLTGDGGDLGRKLVERLRGLAGRIQA